MDSLLINLLMYGIVPLWLLAGVMDWYFHRRSRIEITSGVKESWLHIAMLAEIGVGTLTALFLEVNAGILILLAALFLIHEATALWDVSYAQSARYLAPLEQHIHSFLEMIPLFVLTVLSVLHWPQLQALFDSPASSDFGIRLKSSPLPASYLAAVLSSVAVLQITPYLEELLRCYRWRKKLSH